MAQQVADGAAVGAAVVRLADTLLGRPGDGPWAVVGIRRNGDVLAARLAALLAARTGQRPPLGVVDITLYRDDGFGPHSLPQVGPTDIPFSLERHTVVLVDDVLYTGRTVRAALGVLQDFGRPRAVRLAVLVDRGLRELPIAADAVGFALQTVAAQHVAVRLGHSEAEAQVWLLPGPVAP